MTTPAERLKMAKAIVDFEARRDSKGRLTVYHLPANDGGGRYEVAGINERYDHDAVIELVKLIEDHKWDEAEAYAEEYIAHNTDGAAKYTDNPAIESYLRDILFNRGAGGMVKTMQIALGFSRGHGADGVFGPNTKLRWQAAENDPSALLDALLLARKTYELTFVGRRENFWKGLNNRWNESYKVAKGFLPRS